MIGEILAGRFRLEERLGGGAQGEIYRARDLDLSRSVAIKIPTGDVDDDFVKTFKREAKLLVKFEHANVVTLHDFYDPEDGMPFLVMEYLQGQPLDERLKEKDRPLTRRQLRNFAKQICGALHKAHEAGLIHRDVKPSNVMLVNEGKRSERFVILDLGIAKLADFVTVTNPTIMGSRGSEFSGTIAYMSPEQLEGSEVDFRSDIYSFGTTLYQIFTGRLPFPPPDTYAGLFGFMQKVVRDAAPPMSEVCPDEDFPPELEKLVQDCMAKDPEERPKSMHVVAGRLLKCLPGDVTSAPGEAVSPMADTQVISGATVRNLRRPRAGARLRSLAGVAVVAAVVFFGLWWMRDRGEATTSPPVFTPSMNLTTSQPKLRVVAGDADELNVTLVANVKGYAELKLSGVPGIAWGDQHPGESYQTRLHIAPDEPQTVEIAATAAVDAPPGKQQQVTLTATIPGNEPVENQRRLAVEIQPPHVWTDDNAGFSRDPTSGLFPHPKNADSGRGKKVYLPGRIERVVTVANGGEIRLRFVLIHPERLKPSDPAASDWPAGLQPFYMLEDKVPNRWVATCRDMPESGFESAAWTFTGPDAPPAPPEGLFPWLTSPEDFPNVPAMNLTVEEAHAIAQWLTDKRGTLPSLQQWDAAAGLYDRNIASVGQGWPEGPYHGAWNGAEPLDVVVGRKEGHEPPGEVGVSKDDVSPYGIHDMAGNGLEFTADVFSAIQKIGVVPIKPPLPENDEPFVVCRGREYFGTDRPLRFADINDIDLLEIPEIPYPDRARDVGFRIVVPID